MQGYGQQQLQQQQQQQLINAMQRNQFMKQDQQAAMKNIGNQLGALQAAHQQAAAAASKAAAANMNLRSHMGPGHGGAVGMQQQAVTQGPTYSPTPIQRPQGKKT